MDTISKNHGSIRQASCIDFLFGFAETKNVVDTD